MGDIELEIKKTKHKPGNPLLGFAILHHISSLFSQRYEISDVGVVYHSDGTDKSAPEGGIKLFTGSKEDITNIEIPPGNTIIVHSPEKVKKAKTITHHP